jgi:hypothetical protein
MNQQKDPDASRHPDTPAQPDTSERTPDAAGGEVSEAYRRYKEAADEEARRLERYERTKSTNTEHPVRDQDQHDQD